MSSREISGTLEVHPRTGGRPWPDDHHTALAATLGSRSGCRRFAGSCSYSLGISSPRRLTGGRADAASAACEACSFNARWRLDAFPAVLARRRRCLTLMNHGSWQRSTGAGKGGGAWGMGGGMSACRVHACARVCGPGGLCSEQAAKARSARACWRATSLPPTDLLRRSWRAPVRPPCAWQRG